MTCTGSPNGPLSNGQTFLVIHESEDLPPVAPAPNPDVGENLQRIEEIGHQGGQTP
ncbi:MAG: hypothetical protein HZB39_16465 [Planctomycetes bacterium]|nr:hypothetical protein [Planctomycetota bacterium]